MAAVVITDEKSSMLYHNEDQAMAAAEQYMDDEVARYKRSEARGMFPTEGSWVKVFEADELTHNLTGMLLMHLTQQYGEITDVLATS